MAIMGRAEAQELAVCLARVAVQVPAFTDIRAVIISNNLVKGNDSSSSRVIKAIRSS